MLGQEIIMCVYCNMLKKGSVDQKFFMSFLVQLGDRDLQHQVTYLKEDFLTKFRLLYKIEQKFTELIHFV